MISVAHFEQPHTTLRSEHSMPHRGFRTGPMPCAPAVLCQSFAVMPRRPPRRQSDVQPWRGSPLIYAMAVTEFFCKLKRPPQSFAQPVFVMANVSCECRGRNAECSRFGMLHEPIDELGMCEWLRVWTGVGSCWCLDVGVVMQALVCYVEVCVYVCMHEHRCAQHPLTPLHTHACVSPCIAAFACYTQLCGALHTHKHDVVRVCA